MKKCSLCGWENTDERTYCQQCAGTVRSMSPLSEEARRRVRVGAAVCRTAGVLAVLCTLVLFFWPRVQGGDPEGPEPYIRGIRIAVAAVVAYAFLRAGSYLDWRSRGVML
jgi:hypothetical protein